MTPRHFLFLIACVLPTGTGWAFQASADWGDELAPQEGTAAVDSGPTGDLAWPAPPLLSPPAAVRAVYLNAWVFGGQRFYNLVALADTTEVNAFVIDIKDDTGYMTYRSSVPTAIEIGANKQRRARDTRERLRLLHAKGIYPIARIVVAKDPLLAQEKMEWSVRHLDGGLWRDRLDFAWVDAYNDSVWIYAADLAEEAISMGFSEIQFDYVRFPDEPKKMMESAVFNARREGETTRNGVARNLRLLRDRMHALEVPLTIDVFGMTASTKVDLGIGQVWEDLVTTADVVLPMVYPSHYYHSFYGIKHPNSEPYRVVKHALADALEKNAELGVDTEIRPFLQAFTLRKPRYTPWYIREQIRAAEDLGINSWVLWNARGVYDPRIFRPDDSDDSGGSGGR
ncbi:MAG: putative glycoside hydrolase [Gemmatimonadales bacterium]